MARNKRPALTSPWKIGFFVSLLLVAVGIGVGFFITRSFGVTWSWIEFHGTWSEFTFHREAFMVEMLPIAGLVTVLALLAYLIITGAVRKYRQYLDSGVDYKRLVQSLSKIDDLSDETEIRRLSNHPELRTFLLNLRTSVMERQKALDAREVVLADSEADASRGDLLASEVDVLVSAIIAGADAGFQRDLAITVPELKRLEQAIREHLVDAAAARAQEELAELRADLERSATALRARLEEIQEELTQSEQSARELESEVSTLRAHATVAAPATGNGDAERAVSRLDSISEVLNSLGEETRSVAISTALRASSSETSVEGIVKLADDVRDVAAKFNGVAAQWDEASVEARQAFTAAGSTGNASPHMGESLDLLSNRVALWAERTVILVEKVKTFEKHFSEALAGAILPPAATPEIKSTQSGDWGLETTTVRPTVVEDDPAIESEDEQVADASGFEKQEGLFSEIAGVADDEPGMFTDIPVPESAEEQNLFGGGSLLDTAQVDLETADPEPVDVVANNMTDAVTEVVDDAVTADLDDTEDAPNAPAEYVIDEEPVQESFHTNSAIDEVIAGTPPPVGSGKMPAVELDTPATATLEEEEVIDLYALGAVEYDPENIHHNA